MSGNFGPTQMWQPCNMFSYDLELQETKTWKPGVTVGGHFESVEDIAWEPESGKFLLSVSGDQTTRLHALWNTGPEIEVTMTCSITDKVENNEVCRL